MCVPPPPPSRNPSSASQGARTHADDDPVKTHLEIDYHPPGGQLVVLDIRGDLFGRNAQICIRNGPPVAEIQRDWMNMSSMFGSDVVRLPSAALCGPYRPRADGKQYNVCVAPGVDLSLISCLCICFDEIKNTQRRDNAALF